MSAFPTLPTPPGIDVDAIVQDILRQQRAEAVLAEYLDALFAPDDLICIMTLRQGEAPRHTFATAAEATSAKFMDDLRKQNDAGANIFVCMNPLTADRRVKQNVASIRTLYLDIDQNGAAALKRISESPLVPRPHCVLQSSPGKFQAIWLVKDIQPADQEQLLDALIQEFGGDRAASDMTRVLRLPGFVNHKYDHKPVVELVESNLDADRYEREDFKVAVASFKKAEPLPDIIPDGKRNDTLTSLAGSMRRRSASEAAILAALQVTNEEQCQPPLSDDEVAKIAASVANYEPAIDKAPVRSEAESVVVDLAFHRTELGNAKRLVSKFGENIRFNHEQRKWYEWTGKVWARDRIAGVKRLMKSIARDIFQEGVEAADPDDRETLVKWALRSESEHVINNALALAASEDGIPILTEAFDRDTYLLNLNNGTLDLRTGEFREHRREDLLTNITPVDYEPTAKCPRWEQFLREVMDEGTIPFLQRAVGYSLTGFTGEHCFFLLYGLGRNGKSTFLSIIQHILGDYAMQTDWQSFAASKNGGIQIRNDIARLHGARFVAAVESEHNVRLAESLIKSLTGGDRITARFLYQEAFEFVPQMKLWLATNHKPKVIGTDEAIWSRIKLIPFNITVPPEKRDRHLMEKLKKETSGILNWALEGLRVYQQDGLQEPRTVSDATAQYKENSDVLQHFLDAKCTVANDVEVRASDLYEAYKSWVGTSGEYQLNERDFGMTLEERGFRRTRISARKDKPGGVYWHGVTLTQSQARSNAKSDQDSEDLPF